MSPRLVVLLAALPLASGCVHAPPAPPVPPVSAAESPLPPIVQAGDPVLRGRAAEVPGAQLGSPELAALVQRMVEAMRAAPGVGLAAPQLGVPLRVIVLEDTEARMASLTPAERAERGRVPFPLRVLVNPVLRPVGERRDTFFEGCLSVRGYAGLVARAHAVEVTAVDERGAPVRWEVAGWPARILQHEVDHLDGTLYVDRMHTRSFSTQDQAKGRFAGKPAADILRELGLSP
jgi:peptide deformylase